jgi:hypothetical protein
MVEGNYGGNRWFADGITAINKAKTKADAEAAANVWLDRVKRDPNLLVGAAAYFLDKNVKKKMLVKKGWATDRAVQITSEIQIALGRSRITPSVAPSNGTNSGVSGGQVVAAATSGISGDRKAIKVVLPKGKTIWVMARCGNPVTIKKPHHLDAKKWRQDPYAQGNAPIGGGPNTDPGPGDYVSPGDMETPGPGTRTNPPTPAPTWSPTPGATPTATPTKEPTPLPTPTPEVPTPAASGTVSPPKPGNG